MSKDLTQEQIERGGKQGVGTIFAGQVINVSQIARATGISQSAFSLYLSGDRKIPLQVALKIAAHLSMSIEEFIDALNERIILVRQNREQIVTQHEERIEREDKEDIAKIRQGLTPVPRLPNLRA